MILAFTLSMPGCQSWNGKWSGEGRKYAITHTFTKKEDIKNAVKILNERSFHYRWDDGWVARIDVHEVDSKQKRKLSNESLGFCNYDWMVRTIIQYGKPMADHEIKLHLAESWGVVMVSDKE